MADLPGHSRRRLAAWLRAQGHEAERIEPLAGDVSSRSYFRALDRDGRSVILAVYPEALRSECTRFLRAGRLLAEAGVRCPEVLAADCGHGLMLVEDLGAHTLYETSEDLTEPSLEAYFDRAAELIDRIGAIPGADVEDLNPPLDASLLRYELQLAWTHFLEPRGLVADSSLAAALRRCFDAICEALGNERRVVCHRDFMVRNLVPLGEPPELGVLDHQGLRSGPLYYDLASLLNDSRFPAPATEERLLSRAAPGSDEREIYHRAAVQRTLKAIGTYAMAADRGRTLHSALIRPTLERALGHLARLPEASGLIDQLAAAWKRDARDLLDC